MVFAIVSEILPPRPEKRILTFKWWVKEKEFEKEKRQDEAVLVDRHLESQNGGNERFTEFKMRRN